jgi:hypothetical protein
MKTWILIFYMVSRPGYSGGGPDTVEFPTKEACVTAHETLKANSYRYIFGICINRETGKRE